MRRFVFSSKSTVHLYHVDGSFFRHRQSAPGEGGHTGWAERHSTSVALGAPAEIWAIFMQTGGFRKGIRPEKVLDPGLGLSRSGWWNMKHQSPILMLPDQKPKHVEQNMGTAEFFFQKWQQVSW